VSHSTLVVARVSQVDFAAMAFQMRDSCIVLPRNYSEFSEASGSL
jgi:hypothetical protein